MLEGSFSGQTLTWQRIHDPRGAWGLLHDDEVVAEFSWSRDERAVRVEIDSEVWWMRRRGAFPIRATLVRGSQGACQLVYAGGARRGLALCRERAGFVLTCGREVAEGRRRLASRRGRIVTWTGVDDTVGRTVLRANERVGARGFFRSVVSVAPDPRYRSYLSRLLALWGGLRVLMGRSPWLAVVSPFVSEAAAQRGITELQPSLSDE